jgi:hypothetical protein
MTARLFLRVPTRFIRSSALFSAIPIYSPFGKGFFCRCSVGLSAPTPVFLCCDPAFSIFSLLLPLWFLGAQHALLSVWSQQAQLLLACTLVGAQMASLAFGGLYQESYCVIGLHECVVLLRSVGLSIDGGLLVIVSLARQANLALIVVDAYLLATLVIGLRLSFAILDYISRMLGSDECSFMEETKVLPMRWG